MPIARTDLELKLLAALKRIASYMSVEAIRRDAKNTGLEPEEYLEMAYDNVRNDAKRAVKGVRVLKARTNA